MYHKCIIISESFFVTVSLKYHWQLYTKFYHLYSEKHILKCHIHNNFLAF